jgi:hypothetical protein
MLFLVQQSFNSIQFNSNSILQSFNYTPYLFYKKRFISEINSFCIWTQSAELIVRRQGLVWNLEQKVRHDLFHSEPEIFFISIKFHNSIWHTDKLL